MNDGKLTVRAARREDLEDIVRLLAQDAIPDVPVELGPPLPAYYLAAFERIDADRLRELRPSRIEPIPGAAGTWHRSRQFGPVGGEDPQAALRKAAAEWDATNKRLGLEPQKAAYEQFKQLPGSYADHTVEKLGQAVRLT